MTQSLTWSDKVVFTTFTCVIAGVTGAAIAVMAKGVLGAFSISILSATPYGSIAAIGSVGFAAFSAGVSTHLSVNGTNRINWRACAFGIAAFLPVVWLTSLPVVTSIAFLALNITISYSPYLIRNKGGYPHKKRGEDTLCSEDRICLAGLFPIGVIRDLIFISLR